MGPPSFFAQQGGFYPEPVEVPLSVWDIFYVTTLKAQRVECQRKEVAPTRPRPRFARRGQASRIYPLRSKRFAVSDVFPLWRARALAASRPSALPRAFSAKMRRDVRPRTARPVRLTAWGRFVSREAASNRARNLKPYATQSPVSGLSKFGMRLVGQVGLGATIITICRPSIFG